MQICQRRRGASPATEKKVVAQRYINVEAGKELARVLFWWVAAHPGRPLTEIMGWASRPYRKLVTGYSSEGAIAESRAYLLNNRLILNREHWVQINGLSVPCARYYANPEALNWRISKEPHKFLRMHFRGSDLWVGEADGQAYCNRFGLDWGSCDLPVDDAIAWVKETPDLPLVKLQQKALLSLHEASQSQSR